MSYAGFVHAIDGDILPVSDGATIPEYNQPFNWLSTAVLPENLVAFITVVG
jgi:hypothetical protein